MSSSADTYLLDQILESWDRQAQMLVNLCTLVTDENRKTKSSPDGWPIDEHLCHVHDTRYYWIGQAAPGKGKEIGEVYEKVGEEWQPIPDLEEIKRQLPISAKSVREAVREAILAGSVEAGPYSSPIMFLQHMLWHEGYHFSLILLALRNAGCEPSEDWEDVNVWGLWRTSS